MKETLLARIKHYEAEVEKLRASLDNDRYYKPTIKIAILTAETILGDFKEILQNVEHQHTDI